MKESVVFLVVCELIKQTLAVNNWPLQILHASQQSSRISINHLMATQLSGSFLRVVREMDDKMQLMELARWGQFWSFSANATQQIHCSTEVGTCESLFCVRIESRIESAVRFDFESNFRIESAVYTTQAVTPSNELQGAPCSRTVYLSWTRVMHATEYLLFISIQS